MPPTGALEFAIADSKDAVPSNAIVFAVCSEERALSIQDADLLDTLIDREFATFQTLLREAREGGAEATACLEVLWE